MSALPSRKMSGSPSDQSQRRPVAVGQTHSVFNRCMTRSRRLADRRYCRYTTSETGRQTALADDRSIASPSIDRATINRWRSLTAALQTVAQ